MRSFLAVLVVVLSLFAGAGNSTRTLRADKTGLRTIDTLTRDYSQLVRRYAAGDSDVVSELAAWPNDDARRAVQRFVGTVQLLKRLFVTLATVDPADHRRRAQILIQLARVYDAIYTGKTSDLDRSGSVAVSARAAAEAEADVASQSWRRGLPDRMVAYLRAAVGLHTAATARAWRTGVLNVNAADVEFAAAYGPELLVPLDPEFMSLWCRSIGTLLTSSNQQAVAVRELDRCTSWFPDDEWIRLARGSAYESASILVAHLPSVLTIANWPEVLRNPSRSAEQALNDYTAALELDPTLVEATVRRARLRMLAGDADDAATELDRTSKQSAPVLQYWIAMLRGAASERRRNEDQAIVNYRGALALYPCAQSAAIAISYVLAEDLGKHDDAVAALRACVAVSRVGPFQSDPWRLYPMAQAWRVSEWLDEIRRRSVM